MSAPCPSCGEALRRSFCPECGYDAELEQDTYLDGVELPQDFEYEDMLQREGLGEQRAGLSPLWLIAVFFAILALVLLQVL